MTREIVLDTETTGLDPSQGHRIVEIGAVETGDIQRFRPCFGPVQPCAESRQSLYIGSPAHLPPEVHARSHFI